MQIITASRSWSGRKSIERTTNSLLHSFTSWTIIRQWHGCGVVSFTACWKSYNNLSLDSFTTVLFSLTKCNIVHFVTNSNGDDFFNARLPSRGWCIPRRVGSDPWYRDMIACGAVAFSCRTLRFGFNIWSRIKNDRQQQTNWRYVDYLIKKKKIICSMKLALRSF